MILQFLGNRLAATSVGKHIKAAWQSEQTQDSLKPIKSVVWESPIGRRVIRPLSTIAFHSLSIGVDGYVAGAITGTALTTTLALTTPFFSIQAATMSTENIILTDGIYSAMKLGEIGQKCGRLWGAVYGTYEVVASDIVPHLTL